MPSIKELKRIYDVLPLDQAILLKGGHGKGKSESVRSEWESKGYRVESFFLGQMSDAGDILGLPDRIEKTVGDKQYKVTDFCVPQWFPLDPMEKVVLFLDELNRAKPELNNVIMDLVLNRKLAGKSLPHSCKIISAINPSDDDYQVEDMDKALLDRFNVYDFTPTLEDWIDWAVKVGVNRSVISFLSNHEAELDPPTGKMHKSNTVYPSRRSWKRVSDIMNNNKDLLNELDTLQNVLMGIVGAGSTALFMRHLREMEKGLRAGLLITQFKERREEFEMKLKRMSVPDIIAMNRELILWFNDNSAIIKDGMSNSTTAKYVNNLQMYLSSIPSEAMAEFFNLLSAENVTKQYPKLLFMADRTFANSMADAIRGTKSK